MLRAAFVLLCLVACAPDATEPEDAGPSEGEGEGEGEEPAFGDPCTLDGTVGCGEGELLCISPEVNDGFCSKSCEVQGAECPDAPEGTIAFCIVEGAGTPNGERGCAFLCAGGGQTFACPGELVCSTVEEPAGSGQRLCLP